MDEDLYKKHAEVCKVFSHPRRLEILNVLMGRELSVGEIMEKMKIRESNLSQHLAVLRDKGVVVTRKSGLNVFYRVSNPKILKACNLMREVLLERMKSDGMMAEEMERKKK